jgi:hypothetical protein
VTVKVVDVSVPQVIASLKVAVSACPTGTLVAALKGTVAVTVGGGVMVVKVHT